MATPQVILTKRRLETNEYARRIAPPEETLLLRLIGLDAVRGWASLGYPVPGVQ